MAGPYFVDSSIGASGAGTAWSTAYKTLAEVDSIAGAGEEIRIRDTHTETIGASLILNFTGSTPENPVKIISVTKGASDAGANDVYNAGAVIFNETGAYDCSIYGHFYMAGVTMTSTSASTQLNIGSTSNNVQHYYECTFTASGGTSTYMLLNFGSSITLELCTLDVAYVFLGTESNTELINCSVTTDHPSQTLVPQGDHAKLRAWGCSFTNTSGEVFAVNETKDYVNCSITDSQFSTALTQDEFTTGHHSKLLIERCSTSTNVTAPTLGITQLTTSRGIITSDSAVTRNASDGTTPHTWKMSPNTNVKTLFPLKTPLLVAWVTTSDTSIKVNISCPTGTTDAEFWIEALSPNQIANPSTTNRGLYQSTQSASSGVVIDPMKALGTANDSPVALATRFGDSTGWSGTRATDDVYAELTIAPAEDGPVQILCCLGSDIDVWIDPIVEVT